MIQKKQTYPNDWHAREALAMLYYGLRRHLKVFLRLPRRPEVPVVHGDMAAAVARYRKMCARLLGELGPSPNLAGQVVCEIGAGDGLAVAALLMGLGASRVHLVEVNPPVVSSRQVEILERLEKDGLPLRADDVLERQPLGLKEGVVYHQCYMDQVDMPATFDLIFSHAVLEHVEDIDDFFGRCFRSLKSGGRMVHWIDLGGHGSFEEPMPPLEFQIYPDWLFYLMSPPFTRARRRAAGEYIRSAQAAGFTGVVMKPTRLAEPDYLEAIWPRLNRRIRKAGKPEVAVIEFILGAVKP